MNESYAGKSADRLTLGLPGASKADRAEPRLEYWKKFPAARRLMILPVIVLLSLVLGALLGAGFGAEPLVMLMVGLIAVPFVWRRPVLGVYALILATATVESYNMGFPDSFTDAIPLHQPFNQMGLPLPVTATELMMVGMLGLLMLKRIGARARPVEFGPLFPAVLGYTLFATYGIMRGMGNGGDINVAVWEVRAQFYIPIVYLLAYNLITTRDEARRVMWLFLAAVAFKGLVGVFRLIVTLRGDTSQITVVSRANSLMSHEESLLYAGLLVFGVLLFVFKADKAQLKLIMYAAFPVALAFLANQRRAGIMAMILSLLVIAVVIYIQMPERRRQLVYVAIAAVLIMVPYTFVFRNASGLVAEPARAVLSIVRPDERDSGSNDYRVLEGENVGQNIALNPIFGAGYGVPMQMFVPLPDLTNIFSLWAYIPHNTILWVWLRLGIFGFAAFWFMVGRFMIESAGSARRTKDPYLKAISIFTITFLIAWVAQGLVDMGITDFRLNILVTAFIGVTARIPRMEREAAERAEAEAEVGGEPELAPEGGMPPSSGRGGQAQPAPRHALQMSGAESYSPPRKPERMNTLRANAGVEDTAQATAEATGEPASAHALRMKRVDSATAAMRDEAPARSERMNPLRVYDEDEDAQKPYRSRRAGNGHNPGDDDDGAQAPVQALRMKR